MKKQANLFSIQLLLSYLSILAVPLLAIWIVYSTASEMMYKIQQEKMLAQLQTTALETQQSLEEAANLGIYISSAREFTQMQQLLRQENRRATFFEMYQLSLVFPNYPSFNSMVRDVYFFFQNQDYVIRLPAVVPATERSYESIGALLENDYESMKRMLGYTYYDMQVITLNNREGTGRMLAIAQSFPFGAYSNSLGTALILMNDNTLRTQLSSNLEGEYGITAMLDSTGRVLTEIVGEQSHSAVGKFSYDALAQENFSEIQINGVRYAVCRAQTETTGHIFYTLMPKRVLINKIGSIRQLIILMCIVSGLIGLGSCIVLWSRRRAVVLRYCRYETEFGHVAERTSSFWEGVHAVLDSVGEMQNTIRQKLNFQRSAVIQKLLNGEYGSEERLREDLKSAEIVLDGTAYYAVAIRFKRSMQTAQSQTMAEFHLCMRECVAQVVQFSHYCCEPEDMMLALVVPTRTEESLRILKEELHRLEDRLVAQEHVEAFVGIGMKVLQLTDLAASYHQARSVCDYLQFYNIRLVMEDANLPRSNAIFFFPMEMELSLIRVIEQGDRTALEDLFRVITHENESVRALTTKMHEHLVELVRCTAIRALREIGSDGILYALGNAETLESVLDLLECAIPCVVCANEQRHEEHLLQKKERMQQLIEQGYEKDNYTIVCLAQKMEMSETKLYKEFRQMFGVSFSDYLENLRIHKACELLKLGTTVKDVSARVGYCSDYSFRRAFKRVIGLSPSHYMESLKK